MVKNGHKTFRESTGQFLKVGVKLSSGGQNYDRQAVWKHMQGNFPLFCSYLYKNIAYGGIILRHHRSANKAAAPKDKQRNVGTILDCTLPFTGGE